MQRARHVKSMREMSNEEKILVERKNRLSYIDINRILLKVILNLM
jgi:hypothetical protein